ncbi:MAG: hypothetical protein K2N30_00460, partial [Clostridia bacterium]|nr:hypothetical protein [Clostridia bacterium]
EVFCLFSNISPEEKPVGIRFKQTFTADPVGTSSLVDFICSKLNKQAKKLCSCKNCGAIFELGERNSCRFHPKEAVISKIKNFDGTEQKYWIFPCCNKKLVCSDENKRPPRSNGCVIGKHSV